jgi:Cdc6-like AAA superfamily ATPase
MSRLPIVSRRPPGVAKHPPRSKPARKPLNLREPPKSLRVSDVFVTARPEWTYLSRDSSQLEAHVRDHLEERDKLLLITGPTKTGKTVLVDHVVPKEVAAVVRIEGPNGLHGSRRLEADR